MDAGAVDQREGGGAFIERQRQVVPPSMIASAPSWSNRWVKKGNFQSAAEAFAKHFNDDYLKKR